MDTEDYKKYNIVENVLQKINQKCVALQDDEIKRNNKVLQVITDRIIQKMRGKNPLFHNLYQNKFYGGSYYDGLKVGNPSEYDLDCILCLPKAVEPKVDVSDKPGYVHVNINLEGLERKAPKYLGLDKFLDGNRLSTKKVRSWMEGLMSSATTKRDELDINDSKCVFEVKVTKSGPALTIKLDGRYDDKDFHMDIDLVPCFTFFDDHWPKEGYRSNSNSKKNTFFVVPKSPSDGDSEYWRLSFQEQERDLIKGYPVMKPTIRLIKKMRDRHQHAIASYFIKTVFLWELEKYDGSLWQKPLSYVFMTMLRKYAEYIEQRRIPYYWNNNYNLIGDLSDVTASCIANKLKNIVAHVERICNTKSDVHSIVQYFLASDEIDMEVFKSVPLSKKLLKQMEASKPASQDIQIIVVNPEQPEPCTSSRSSVASSFEEISQDMLDGPTTSAPAPQFSQTISKLEIMCLTLVSEQKRLFGMLETAIDKIDSCETQIQRLAKELDNRKSEDILQRNELLKTLGALDKKIDGLLKKDEPVPKDDLIDLILGETDKLKNTVDFQGI